jgi:S-adenosylmethionine-diacylglycerol 3-amino-3-carboxypropyl transferase
MTKRYFHHLNYVLGNEDLSVENGILKDNLNHVFSAAGSGTRIIPLLARYPRHLTCADVSKEQLFITELRIESLRSFSYEEYLAFWGYPPKILDAKERKEMYAKLNLSKNADLFLLSLFESENWNSILYSGRWEKTFLKISKILDLFLRGKNERFFNFTEYPEHHEYLKNGFPHRRWEYAIFFLGNSTIFNALLYRGNFPKKNIPVSFQKFYKNAFDNIFKQGPARNNFFLQLLFLGKISFIEGLPFDCERDIFLKAKQALQTTKLQYVCADIVEAVRNAPMPIDFLSFSDIASYFSGSKEKTFMEDVNKNLTPNALVVLRHYLRIPNVNLENFLDVTSDYQHLIDNEKMQVYSIQVLMKKI